MSTKYRWLHWMTSVKRDNIHAVRELLCRRGDGDGDSVPSIRRACRSLTPCSKNTPFRAVTIRGTGTCKEAPRRVVITIYHIVQGCPPSGFLRSLGNLARMCHMSYCVTQRVMHPTILRKAMFWYVHFRTMLPL